MKPLMPLFHALVTLTIMAQPAMAQAPTHQCPLAPSSTFLRTDTTDTPLPPTFVLDLQQLGVLPNSTIRLSTTGSFLWHPGQPLQGTNAVAVFSTSSSPLAASAANRVPTSIPCNAPPYTTAPTLRQNLPTDIPDDFLVHPGGVQVTVPLGVGGAAPFLLVGADDLFWSDNVSNGFEFVLEATDRRYVFRILCLDASRSAPCGTSDFSFPTSSQFSAARAEVTSPTNFGLGGTVAREARFVVTRQIDSSSLDDIDLVLLNPLAGAPPLSTCEVATLADFVRQGGGLFAFENSASAGVEGVTGSGPIASCSGGSMTFAGSHPVLAGHFGTLAGGLGAVYHCRMSFVGPNGTPFLTNSNGTVGAAFSIGAGHAIVINEEEFLMSSGGCPASPSWSLGNPRRTLLNSLAWVMPPAAFRYTPGATYCTFGHGCSGSNGIPELRSLGGPTLGTQFRVDIANLPAAGGGAFMIVGFSNQAWLGWSLPLDLANFGMAGCTGYVSVDSTYFLLHSNGVAQWQTSIPADPGLSGVTFYNQALSIDPAATTTLGAVVSNTGRGIVR